MRGGGCIVVFWLLLALCGAQSVRADDPPKARRSPSRFLPQESIDSLTIDSAQLQRTDRLYDSIRAKTSRRKLTKALYSSLFRRPVRDTTHRARVVDEAGPMRPYAGREIRKITIERLLPFDKEGNWWERAANNLHTLTRYRIIHRDLLFGVGDPLDPDLVARNKQLLQSRRYISDVDVRIVPDTLDTTRVDVVIRTRDNWTIDVDAGVHSGGEFSFGLSESNLWGRGHELRLETNLNYRTFDYGGNLVEYRVPNMWGSFYEFGFEAGKEFDRSRFALLLKKEFLRTTDYEVGAEYRRSKEKHRFPDRDTTELVNSRKIDLWGGYSLYLPSVDASLYMTGRYSYYRSLLRPDDASPTMHPALHDSDLWLMGLGLYREHLYSATMMYGYGKREYLSAGFRSELTAGYRWGEFGEDLYLGLSHTMGGFLRMGYLMGRFEVGSFINEDNEWRQAALDARLEWFSNLYKMRRTHVRQILQLGYTQGWDRLSGADEWLEFTKYGGPRVLDEDLLGTTRLVLNAETVFFTPYEPLGFKMTLFSFLDGGLLGYHDNVFKNDPWCAFGFGVRLRNERLVFRTLQIRLGIAFGRHGWAASDWIRLSSEPDMQRFRYTPQRPEVLIYK